MTNTPFLLILAAIYALAAAWDGSVTLLLM
ncbi:Uncharacterised protein [Serratia quinivorans]|nr:Uncharacterised protein [Serratia quinivorans]VEI71651.1 Uncharacterised protein [Serratia quinivorans]